MSWRGTHAHSYTFHAATCRNAYEQFDSCNNLIDVKMTSPTFRGRYAHYIVSSGATKLKFGELKGISKIRKVKKLGTYKFNTVDII